MKRSIVIAITLLVTANAFAFCSLTDDNCRNQEEMMRMQRKQYEQQNAYQNEQLRLQRQQMRDQAYAMNRPAKRW